MRTNGIIVDTVQYIRPNLHILCTCTVFSNTDALIQLFLVAVFYDYICAT